ncbi:hypothetical protein [Planctomicrobium piriforme]|uniref:ATP-grasp domain-containing protein n=1 Tax=Planctomicrobium piriforme TaxID=1576369 RepID=A0A1I3S7D4_9PLAN|nr:hypothetical protein [Planctomicrobium piriforme]SFJ54605.1 hypothetical protein SAMN05421753_12345 [Planctomicrobium piriforme]
MTRLFVGNFSFEQAREAGWNPSRTLARFEAELACVWLAVMREGDELLCPLPLDADYLAHMQSLGCPKIRVMTPDQLETSQARELVPWGWTPDVRRLAEKLRIPVNAPDQETVWQANSRLFSWLLCRELSCVLPTEGFAASLTELMLLLRSNAENAGGWVIKPNLGQAGRGQLRGTVPTLTEQQFGAVLHLISRQGGVAVEPLLERVAEVGCQWEIKSDGTAELKGVMQLLTDARGAYLGTGTKLVEIAPPARENIVQVQAQAVERIAAGGYFGPLGIDAMVYRREGELAVRPIQDINARWTMGRVGWEWSRRLSMSGRWLHHPEQPEEDAAALSPEWMDGAAVRCRTWWVRDRESVQAVE